MAEIGWIYGWRYVNVCKLADIGWNYGNWKEYLVNTSSLKITKEILSFISEIDEFKGAWRALGVLAPERLTNLRQVATIESIGSSTRIEGSKLTDVEVEKLLKNINIENFSSRDEQEVAGYSHLMEMVFSNWEEIALTENYIKQLHRELLKYSDKDDRHRGAYKKLSNSVEAFDSDGNSLGVVFETTSCFDTPKEMSELIAWLGLALENKETHVLLVTAVFIVKFLAIHPFQDGNGRLSRVLTTLLLLKAGYLYVPYASLESVIEKTKDSYYLALRKTQGTLKKEQPNWQPWVVYFLKVLYQQKENLEKKLETEHIIFNKLPELSVQILDYVKNHGRITMSEAITVTGASRGTIKDHISSLVKKNQLAKHGSGRGTWYSLV